MMNAEDFVETDSAKKWSRVMEDVRRGDNEARTTRIEDCAKQALAREPNLEERPARLLLAASLLVDRDRIDQVHRSSLIKSNS